MVTLSNLQDKWDLRTNMKGLVVTTFNSEPYFDDLYNSIPFDRIDHVVVVNGGHPYTKSYDKCHWIQHDIVKYASVARNDGLKYLLNEGCEHLFICEDDMIIKSSEIFDRYIKASNESGLQYFGFKSNAWGAGSIEKRTPRISFQYTPEGEVINLMKNTCNEWTYRSRKCIEQVGLYDERFQYTFDIEWLYRASESDLCSPFWYFADIASADDLVMNNPIAVSRMNPNNERLAKLGPNMQLFEHKHRVQVPAVPDTNMDDLKAKIENIKRLYGK